MFLRTRQLAVAIAAIVTLIGGSLVLAPSASASSGGGCRNSPHVSYGTIGACISAQGHTVIPDAYLNFSSIPRGCSASIELYVEVNGVGQPIIGPIPFPCRKGWLGALNFGGMQNGTYYNVSCVQYSGGGTCANSPFEYLK
jgi:hypothetical protein